VILVEIGACMAAALVAAATLAPVPRRMSPTHDRSAAARTATVPPETLVEVLGEVRVSIAGKIVAMGRRSLEVVAYLATHPEGVGEERLRAAVWPDGAARGTFNNAVSSARAALGEVDGRLLLPTLGEDRRYRLDAALTSDLALLTSLPSDADHAATREAVTLVRGRPFDMPSGFEWAWREGFVGLAERAVATVAHRAAIAHLDAGEADAALVAVDAGLRAVPCDEQLYRDRMHALWLAGNTTAVESVVAELRAVLDVASVEELHPDTVEVYRRCRGAVSR